MQRGGGGAGAGAGGAGSVVSEASSYSAAPSALSGMSGASGWRTPKTWRGKSLDQLLAEKRAQRTARQRRFSEHAKALGSQRLPAYMAEEEEEDGGD